jgi:hypothetical protein
MSLIVDEASVAVNQRGGCQGSRLPPRRITIRPRVGSRYGRTRPAIQLSLAYWYFLIALPHSVGSVWFDLSTTRLGV